MNTKPPKTDRIELRIGADEKELFQRAADNDGRPLSNWIRDRLLRAARQELSEKEGGKGKGKRNPSP
jgi:uncharacterized protein (DUF1778 family)